MVQFRFLGPAGKIEKNELESEIPFHFFVAGDFDVVHATSTWPSESVM